MLPEVGFTELLLIATVALLVLKPEDIPAAMRKLGQLSTTLRRNVNGMWQGWLEQADRKR